ncbi:MAG: hypothetical protein VYD90_11025 [Pseudomonadota bacterium]|nr:hypothetical protein [Pseudomonadota bacterium]
MTPLAMRIVRELALPVKDRTFNDQCGLMQRMDDVHCFEVSDVFDLAQDLALNLHKAWNKDGYASDAGVLGFLPAPKTWIEWTRGGYREAVLLEETHEGDALSSWAIADNDGLFLSSRHCGGLLLSSINRAAIDAPWPSVRTLVDETEPQRLGWIFTIYAMLAIINSPRLIGHKQHMPHRGLERRLAAAKASTGKFPLHAWTELKLSVSDIGKRADGKEYEAHYTGERCLHFCRAHLRVKRGRIEKVAAHYRGNPANGIKRTRYSVAP